MNFSGAAEILGIQIGMIESVNPSQQSIEETIKANAGEASSIQVNPGVDTGPALVLRFETSTTVRSSEEWMPPAPPSGPSIPSVGSVSYGGIVIENKPSSVALPPWNPEAPIQVDDMAVVSLTFSDGTSVLLPPITDSPSFITNEVALDSLGAGRTIVSVDITNNNTHRDVSLRNIQFLDPDAVGIKPRNAVSTAQNAIIVMEGIEIQRPGNTVDDLLPGLTLTLRAPSDRPVNVTVQPDREGVKDALITLVGNYNRLMAEINILTRPDTQSNQFTSGQLWGSRVIDELTYLTNEEREEYQKRLGAFQSDSTLTQFRNVLQRTMTAPYPTSLGRELSLLSQIGIGTDMGRGGASTGLDASRLRGYLEIDEKILDAAIAANLPAIRELFGYDTDGDLLVDTGIAFNLETLARPYVETGGIISLKTRTVDSRISSEQQRINTMDRQLASREAELRAQYAQMENAFNRMERMGQSLERFSQQNSNNNR
jgi:flagellar hook-associated protein 2